MKEKEKNEVKTNIERTKIEIINETIYHERKKINDCEVKKYFSNQE